MSDRYRVLFEHSSDAHLIVDDDGIIDCNRAAISLLGASDRSQVLTYHPRELSPEFQPDGRSSMEKSKEITSTAREQGWHRFEWMLRKIDGTELPVEVTLNAVELDGKQVIIAVWHDLTEIKRKEAALRASEERMRHDLDSAARAQQAMLPPKHLEFDGFKFAWEYRPCDELAGDSLNVVRTSESTVIFYVLDVSGHGVSASLLSVTATYFLSANTNLPPAELIEQLNAFVNAQAANERFVALFYGELNTQTQELRYVAAGHPPAILKKSDGSVLALPGAGIPVGITDEPEYEEEHVKLEHGDQLFMFSDGVPEAMNSDEQQLGDAAVGKFLQEARQPLTESANGLMELALNWCGESKPNDDISILALECTN